MGHEGLQFVLMFRWYLVEASVDSVAELVQRSIVAPIQNLFLDELTQPLNVVQVWRVRRQKQQLDFQVRGQVDHSRSMLIPCIVQHQSDWSLQAQR